MDARTQVIEEFKRNPAGPDKIYRRLKAQNAQPPVTLKQVRDVLLGPKNERGRRDRRQAVKQYVDYLEAANTKRLRAGGLFGKRDAKVYPIVTGSVGDYFEADLIDSSKHRVLFQGMRANYALIVIDDFSRFVWGYPLKTKTKKEIQEAFEKLFQTKTPDRLQSDREAAIVSLVPWFEQRGVEWVNKDHAAPTVEAVIRTLKRKANRLRDIGARDADLKDVIDLYNNDIHGTTKLAPRLVLEDPDAQEAARARGIVVREKSRALAEQYYARYKDEFSIGDFVNHAKNDTFLKGTGNQWDDRELRITRATGNTMQTIFGEGRATHYFPWQVRQAPLVQAVNPRPARAARAAGAGAGGRQRTAAEPAVPNRAKRERAGVVAAEEEDDEGRGAGGRRYAGRERPGYFNRPTMFDAIEALRRR